MTWAIPLELVSEFRSGWATASGTISFVSAWVFLLLSGAGVGELLRLRGEVDFEDAPGDGVGVGLLFPAEGLCRRWLGVGVGVAKNFLIFSPNEDSSVRPSGVDARKKRKTKSSVPTDSRFVRFDP